jgi:hypothetical protein
LVTAVSSGGITAASVLYGGTNYTTGATLAVMALPPASRDGVLSGTLTSNATIIIPAGTYLQGGRRIIFSNNTTGAFTTTVKLSNGTGGSTGTGYVLPQGTNNSTSVVLFTDGVTDVWKATGIDLTTAAAASTYAALTGAAFTGAVSVTGAFTPSQTNGIVGTTTNNNANAGSVGEYTTNNTTGTSLITNTAANATSISLTAGDWDVWGTVYYIPAGTTTMQQLTAGVNTTSATLPTTGSFTNMQVSFTAGAQQCLIAPMTRISLATTTTVYMVAQAGFGVSTMTCNGYINARRRR